MLLIINVRILVIVLAFQLHDPVFIVAYFYELRGSVASRTSYPQFSLFSTALLECCMEAEVERGQLIIDIHVIVDIHDIHS